MSVLVYVDQQDGKIKKAALEALSYGAAIGSQANLPVSALVAGQVPKEELDRLGSFGAGKVLHASNGELKSFDGAVHAALLKAAAAKENATVIVLSHNFHGKDIAPQLSVLLRAGLVTGVISLPDLSAEFTVKKSVFSGKAVARVKVISPVKILTLSPNSFPLTPSGKSAPVEKLEVALPASRVKVTSVEKESGAIPLPEAEIIVSGGRGMKGPENWGMLEALAQALGAATACSRPVADAGWRPHHEHVGQTGLTVRPNLYVALGISGAIQHLAGVNGSKVIVVINKDPEAPFFKAADYGLVGDIFQIVPALTQAVKKFKGE